MDRKSSNILNSSYRQISITSKKEYNDWTFKLLTILIHTKYNEPDSSSAESWLQGMLCHIAEPFPMWVIFSTSRHTCIRHYTPISILYCCDHIIKVVKICTENQNHMSICFEKKLHKAFFCIGIQFSDHSCTTMRLPGVPKIAPNFEV